MKSLLTPENTLPEDGCAGTLVGRVQLPEGPAVVAIRGDGVYDVTAEAPTMSTLLDAADPVAVVRTGLATANRIGDLADILANSELVAIEVRDRRTGEREEVPVAEAGARVLAAVRA